VEFRELYSNFSNFSFLSSLVKPSPDKRQFDFSPHINEESKKIYKRAKRYQST